MEITKTFIIITFTLSIIIMLIAVMINPVTIKVTDKYIIYDHYSVDEFVISTSHEKFSTYKNSFYQMKAGNCYVASAYGMPGGWFRRTLDEIKEVKCTNSKQRNIER